MNGYGSEERSFVEVHDVAAEPLLTVSLLSEENKIPASLFVGGVRRGDSSFFFFVCGFVCCYTGSYKKKKKLTLVKFLMR